jgi:hypothetical protein
MEKTCEYCNKKYKTSTGLFKHTQTCKPPGELVQTSQISEITELVSQLVQMQRQNEDPVQKFLHETCKDAIEITDFCKNITIVDDDMETAREKGHFPAIVQIFLRNMAKYPAIQRPIQRIAYKNNENPEQIFVKYNKTWLHETRDSKLVINSAIAQIIQKSVQTYQSFAKSHNIETIQSITREQRAKFSDNMYDIITGRFIETK